MEHHLHFYCEKQSATLSQAGCAAMYQASKKDGKAYFGSRAKCKGCDMGAVHAGEAIGGAAKNPLYQSHHCPRCHRNASRMVKGLCISCLNRQYELEKGRNAKGSAPVKLRELHNYLVQFYSADGVFKKWVKKTTNRVEAIFHVLRSQPQAVLFGWAAAQRPPMRQLPLF